MILKGVLMDFDGVLLDSFREGLRRIQLVCALHDVKFERATRSVLFNLWGAPGIELLMHGLGVGRDMAKRMYADWEKVDKATPPPLIPGARETLHWLRRNGFASSLITSRHRENLQSILDGYDLTREFAVITAREDCPYHKPDPRVFRHALETIEEKFSILKNECIFVGDTPSDTVAGHDAGLETLVVQTGPYMIEHVDAYPVKLANILRSIEDLPFWIEKNHEGELKHIF